MFSYQMHEKTFISERTFYLHNFLSKKLNFWTFFLINILFKFWYTQPDFKNLFYKYDFYFVTTKLIYLVILLKQQKIHCLKVTLELKGLNLYNTYSLINKCRISPNWIDIWIKKRKKLLNINNERIFSFSPKFLPFSFLQYKNFNKKETIFFITFINYNFVFVKIVMIVVHWI